jgi:hypothetical protein
MIDSIQKVNELESELAVKLDLTEREQRLLEALQYMIDRHYDAHRPVFAVAMNKLTEEDMK